MVRGEVITVMNIPQGSRLIYHPQSTILSYFVSEGYFLSGGNLYSLLNSAIYEDTEFELTERRHVTRAIGFVAWSMQYWWVYVLGLLGASALVVTIIMLAKDNRHWAVYTVFVISLALIAVAITLGVRL